MSRGRRKTKKEEVERNEILYSFCEGSCEATFTKRKGKTSDKVSSFFLNSLEMISDVDKQALRSALNFAHTWYALKKEPDQSVLNQVTYIILKYPEFTPHLTVLLKYLDTDDWLYYALRYCLKTDNDVVKKSIIENHPIWYIFMDKIAKDVKKKRKNFSSAYDSRKERCIIEVFVIFWKDTSCGHNPADKAKSFVNFCIESNSIFSRRLLYNMIQLFPDTFDPKDYEKYFLYDDLNYLDHYNKEGKIVI